MPWKSAKQEVYMQINHPSIWKEWVKKYGHASGYYELIRRKKRRKKRKKKTSKRKRKKR